MGKCFYHFISNFFQYKHVFQINSITNHFIHTVKILDDNMFVACIEE